MEDYVKQYNDKMARLGVSIKRMNALEAHLDNKGDDLKTKIRISIKKITAIKAMVERIIVSEIDFAELKENEINSKFLEIETLIKDIDVLFNKTIHEIEKVIGKRLVIKKKKKE